jgi:rhodanese-related sulfurtransferase
MKKTFALIIIFALTLAACNCNCNELTREAGDDNPVVPFYEAIPAEGGIVSGDTPAEYKKITPEEALEMMEDEGVIILDVRTQEEYDTGYIEGAVLLPDYEIGEKIEELIPDKDTEILIYCRSGRRSENAAKELLEMGYTNVYDFGGIETDWTGEVVIPAVYSVFMQIHESLPYFEFEIRGVLLEDDRMRIEQLTIFEDSIRQQFTDLNIILGTRHLTSMLSFDDWNFDGYLDISLRVCIGGSIGNSPHFFWLWDARANEFIPNGQLEDMSFGATLKTDNENNLITAYNQSGIWYNATAYYEYQDGNFERIKLIERENEFLENDEVITTVTISELINSEWVITDEYVE